MEIALGFVVALIMTLTGIGGGSITTPLLVLLVGVPVADSVGVALIFAAVVKVVSAPVFIARSHVSWKILAYMLPPGLLGVLAGAALLRGMDAALMTALVGLTIVLIAVLNLLRVPRAERLDRTGWLAAVSLPIGVEVGFSSAGAGALGALCMMNLSRLEPGALVGTNLFYGLVLSTVGGSIHWAAGDIDTRLLVQLLIGGVVGAIVGAVLAGRVSAKRYRVALSLLLIVLGGELAWNGLSHML